MASVIFLRLKANCYNVLKAIVNKASALNIQLLFFTPDLTSVTKFYTALTNQILLDNMLGWLRKKEM